ncbi:phosphate acetyltransferase [Bifidobacterium aquikefiricola]|uniref:Phosphate acetyltransferase n=1 Tax=Bifidobacterium aquikefiricola TaxID=3059038 RepID=A0AB39U8Y8_9BIFI
MSLTTSFTILSPESANGRNVVAYGLVNLLSQHRRTAVFRPIACRHELFTNDLIAATGNDIPLDIVRATCPREAREDRDKARTTIVSAYFHLMSTFAPEITVIVGTDKSKIADPTLFSFNAEIAADLKSPVVLAVCSIDRTAKQLLETVKAHVKAVRQAGSSVVALFITGCTEENLDDMKEAVLPLGIPTWSIPAVSLEAGNSEDLSKALQAFNSNVDSDAILSALAQPAALCETPRSFQFSLLTKAQAARKTIVLPEGEDDRIIRSADLLLSRSIVDLIIVGERDDILARGKKLGLMNLDRAKFQSMNDESMLETMTSTLCKLRASKGMTEEKARQALKDASYFGTMLVILGLADGLVSGAVNSTANTVRPALQLIKTKPKVSMVSGAFLMCFKDHVAVFSDCAINLNPNPEQLADIAAQSAETARAFGIDPKIGMLSYSTLGSGKGPDVDLVEEATAILHEKEPDLPVVGPIQFDAAWSPEVAASKAKGNSVAGHVNVFIFPNLSAGNIAYKAVQRSSGAVAVGPILQGLNKPVNDLSRGASVEDIINTVAITAISA